MKGNMRMNKAYYGDWTTELNNILQNNEIFLHCYFFSTVNTSHHLLNWAELKLLKLLTAIFKG